MSRSFATGESPADVHTAAWHALSSDDSILVEVSIVLQSRRYWYQRFDGLRLVAVQQIRLSKEDRTEE